MPDKKDEIGGLWERTDKNGNPWFSGKFDKPHVGDVVIFKNTFKKEGERTPDYRVYKKQQRDAAPEPTYPQDAYEPPPSDDNIPF